MIFTAITALAAIIAAFLAYRIGKKQIEITNFVEIFLHPQLQVIQEQAGGMETKIISWNILIKNASSYPVYLSNFVLNGLKHDIGSSVIPNNPDSWYGIPIPIDIQSKREFSLIVEYEDYLSIKHIAEGFGSYDGVQWQIRSKKSIKKII